MTTTTFIYALFAGLIPSFIWLFFWVREDILHPEPRTLLAAVFLGGALSVFIAIIAEGYVRDVVSDVTTRYILWAAIEEIAKFIPVALIALPAFANDEPIDAMIYCITAALGFAALENMLFVMGPLAHGDVSMSIITGSMRFIGATLLHVVCSASIGFALGFTFYKNGYWKWIATLIGIIVASALHAAFNLSIINGTVGGALQSFAWVWGAVVILIILFEEVKVVQPRVPRAESGN